MRLKYCINESKAWRLNIKKRRRRPDDIRRLSKKTSHRRELKRYPEIAAQWCEERNDDKKPEQFRPGSNEKVWWRCERGHEWETTITSRVEGHGCPYCSGLLAIPGENDLSTLYPEIAAQWNRERNGDKVPEQFLPMSACKVWWKCQKGHEWKSAISSRTAGSGCPYCSKRFRDHRRLI